MARGLLDRLTASQGPSRATRDDHAAILAHLRVLLNTRHGDCATCPDFGIPDFTDCLHNLPGGLLQLQTALQDTIARYEPRLTQISVRAVEVDSSSLVLHFEVSARLAGAADKQVLRFATRIVRGGRVAVG
jgi:type VI secretion system protein